MDTPFYQDTLEPHNAADVAAVTLAATAKTMAPANVWGNPPPIFHRIGKKYRICAFGKITTAATPGNLVIDIYFGSGADANGVILASSAAQTLVASQTNLSWRIDLFVHCRSTGTAGTLFCRGSAFFNTAVIAVGDFLIPASAAVVSGAVDLTAALVANIQFRRSGSTVETATLQDVSVEAMN